MAGMSPEEARNLHEEDEDPQKIFALFDAGQKRQTAPPSPPELVPLRQLLAELVADLTGEFGKLRLRDRFLRYWGLDASTAPSRKPHAQGHRPRQGAKRRTRGKSLMK